MTENIFDEWEREDMERPTDEVYRLWVDAWVHRGHAERLIDEITGSSVWYNFGPPVSQPRTPEQAQAAFAAFLDVYDRDGMVSRSPRREPWNPTRDELDGYASRLADRHRNIYWNDLTSEQQSRLLVIAATA